MDLKLNKPSKKKTSFPVRMPLQEYLSHFNRIVRLPIEYDDLLRFDHSMPLLNLEDNDTLWRTVFYAESHAEEVYKALTHIYAILKTDGDVEVLDHLAVARIDFCTFGNSNPFRIRIINRLNDNYDHFYVKRADASRLYGLELEDLLSPNKVTYLVDGSTLIEEHIAGIPGDDFMDHHLDEIDFNEIRIAKEFVKFNERCFVRLLGDMRAYNYVVDVTPDIEGSQYRIRAIDFDQQSYEGRKNFYLPQYFKDNNPIIFLGIKHMSSETVRQYQYEERSLIANRIKVVQDRVNYFFRIMSMEPLSDEGKINQLKKELNEHHNTRSFSQCSTMGQVVYNNIQLLMAKGFRQSM